MKHFAAAFFFIGLWGLRTGNMPGQDSAKIDQAKFKALYTSAQAADAALAVPDADKLKARVQAFSAELETAKSRSKSAQENQLVGLYAEALLIYRDSLTLLNAQARDRRDGFKIAISYSGEVPQIASRYGLQPIEWDKSTGRQVIPDGTPNYLRAAAGVKLRKANSLYEGDNRPVQETDLEAMKTAMYLNLVIMRQSEMPAVIQDRNRRNDKMFEKWDEYISPEKYAEPETIVYLSSPDDGHYHRKDCTSVHEPLRSMTLKEAVEKGYKPCEKCNPPILKPR